MNKTTCALIAAAVALSLSDVAFAQGNNTLATPTTKSPAAATSGYGTPGAVQSESGTASPNMRQTNSMDADSTSSTPAFGVNNTLARPTTKSPVAQ